MLMFNRLGFRKIILLIGDVFLFYLCLIITLFLGFGQNLSPEIAIKHILPFSLLYLIWFVLFFIFDLYELDVLKTGLSFNVRVILTMTTCLIIGIIFFYAIPSITPKTNLLILVIIFGIALLVWRKLFLYLFSSFFRKRVALFGLNQESTDLVTAFKNNPHLGYELAEVIADYNISDLPEKIEKTKINTLIIAVEELPKEKQFLYDCLRYKINIIDLAKAYETIFQKIPVNSLNYLWFLENLKEGKKELHDKAKRLADIVIALLILIITLPLWPLFSILIKIESPGPVFYKQKRVGKDREIFELIKFRSMHKEAEKDGPVWAKARDPRTTKVGKILRKLHLDEIPQMINIVKGDISLVGPRPERPIFVERLEQLIPHYHLRHLIKPGFTGWAQIKFRYGRTVEDSLEKFQYDLYYIKNRSLMLDLMILLKTWQLFFKRE